MTAMLIAMDGHHDAVPDDHRHPARQFGPDTWTFEHLEPFAIRATVELPGVGPTEFTLIVLFANHCFSREIAAGEVVDEAHVVMDGSVRRVLDQQRYELSLKHLPQLVHDLPNRRIKTADHSRPNFVTMELEPTHPTGEKQHYAVFFEVKKDRKRKRRAILRIQSAYVLERPSKRLLDEKPIRFHTLLKRELAG